MFTRKDPPTQKNEATSFRTFIKEKQPSAANLKPLPRIPKIKKPNPKKKHQEWTHQTYLKYYCFMFHHIKTYKTKELQICRKCTQYLGFKNKLSFSKKHKYLKHYHKSIEAIVWQIKNKQRLTKLQIQTQNNHLLQYLQKIRIQQNSILQQPFQFQHYLQSLNFKPIQQVARICFNQTQIQSSPLNYAIINLDSKFNKSHSLIFQDNNQKLKSFFALFGAEFSRQKNQFDKIKNQIKSQSALIEDIKPSEKAFEPQKTQKKDKKNPKTKTIRKNQIKQIKQINTIKIPYKQPAPQNSAQMAYGIQIEPQEQDSPFLATINFAQNSENSDQLLDLQIMLGLSPQQIQIVEFFVESKLSEFRLMKKPIHQQSEAKQQKSQKQHKCSQSVENNITKQAWTEQQTLRLIAFMTLNQKFFTDIDKIQYYLMNLMTEFVKTRTLDQTQDKYNKLTQKYHSLKEIVKSIFYECQFTKEQFQAELKRQYERYLNNPSLVILECEKIQNILLTEPKLKETQIRPLIQERILQSTPQLAFITFSNEDQSFKELIQKCIEQFKHQFQISQPLRESQICSIYQKMKKDLNNFVTFPKFKAILKSSEQHQKNNDFLKTERMRRNKDKITKFIRYLSEEKSLKFRILVEFRIIKNYKEHKDQKCLNAQQKIILES